MNHPTSNAVNEGSEINFENLDGNDTLNRNSICCPHPSTSQPPIIGRSCIITRYGCVRRYQRSLLIPIHCVFTTPAAPSDRSLRARILGRRRSKVLWSMLGRDTQLICGHLPRLLCVSTRSLTDILIRVYVRQLRQGYFGRRSLRSGTHRRRRPRVHAPAPCMSWRHIRSLALPRAISACLQQYATMLASVRWRRRKTARHWSKAPFLHVRFDEDETALAEIYVDGTWSVRADGGKEVLGLQTVSYIIELLAVAREEYTTGPGSIADAYYVALDVFWTVICWSERLVVAALASGSVCY